MFSAHWRCTGVALALHLDAVVLLCQAPLTARLFDGNGKRFLMAPTTATIAPFLGDATPTSVDGAWPLLRFHVVVGHSSRTAAGACTCLLRSVVDAL